jgi:hypothetical protein
MSKADLVEKHFKGEWEIIDIMQPLVNNRVRWKRFLMAYVPKWNLVFFIIIIIISCHRFSFFPGTSLEPVVNPTTQASSLSL